MRARRVECAARAGVPTAETVGRPLDAVEPPWTPRRNGSAPVETTAACVALGGVVGYKTCPGVGAPGTALRALVRDGYLDARGDPVTLDVGDVVEGADVANCTGFALGSGAPGGEEPPAVAERGWKPQYSLIDLGALGGPMAEALAEAQSRLKESWLMGPHLPGMRTAPFMKLLSAEHLEHLKQACVERQPLEISLDRYRTRRVKHGHASMLQLDAVFSSPTMLLFKEQYTRSDIDAAAPSIQG